MSAAPPSAIICLTGSELTRGETRDLNGSFLATELTELGVRVIEIRLLPDDLPRIESGLRELIDRAEIVISSGGLGPTADDLTIRALANAVGRGVERHEPSARRMREIVLARGRKESEIPANFYKQAEIVTGAEVLANLEGLAPGSLVATARGFLAALPGVPRELRAMFQEEVTPRIAARFELVRPRILRAKLLGLPESWAESRIQALGVDLDALEYGISAKPGELTIKLVARDPTHWPALDDARERFEHEFGADIAWLADRPAAAGEVGSEIAYTRLVHDLLIERGVTVATAESCTGGWIAKRLSDCGGSSAYLVGAVVAYQNEIKERVLGVDHAAIAAHGAVSEVVCRQMALGARRLFGSDYALAVTGIAGPSGASDTKPVGLVYIGLAGPPSALDENANVPRVLIDRKEYRGDREMVRRQSVLRALDLLRRELTHAVADDRSGSS